MGHCSGEVLRPGNRSLGRQKHLSPDRIFRSQDQPGPAEEVEVVVAAVVLVLCSSGVALPGEETRIPRQVEYIGHPSVSGSHFGMIKIPPAKLCLEMYSNCTVGSFNVSFPRGQRRCPNVATFHLMVEQRKSHQ